MHFKEKTVWITGASSGIGKALALEFSKEGANIILSARNEEKLIEVQQQCAYSDRTKILLLDLTEQQTFEQKTKEAIGYFKSIDILINNGGVSQRSMAIDTKLEVDQKLFEINYFGTIGLSKALLPHFVSKNSGQIAVITSVVGKIGTPLRSSYAGSKHALHGFFDSLRAEISENISITLICPGFVNTDVSINALTADGSSQNTKDKATANGLSPELFAKKAVIAIKKKKQEVVIAGALEKFAIYSKRYYPLLLARMLRKVDVT